MVDSRISEECGGLIRRLEELGYRVQDHLYDDQAFGNWYVDFTGPRPIRIIKDRNQFLVDGDRQSLEKVGLWRGFDDYDVFLRKVVAWAEAHAGSA